MKHSKFELRMRWKSELLLLPSKGTKPLDLMGILLARKLGPCWLWSGSSYSSLFHNWKCGQTMEFYYYLPHYEDQFTFKLRNYRPIACFNIFYECEQNSSKQNADHLTYGGNGQELSPKWSSSKVCNEAWLDESIWFNSLETVTWTQGEYQVWVQDQASDLSKLKS